MRAEAIQQKIDNAKTLDFGIIFNDCIELFKKVWLQGFLILLLSFLLSIPFLIIIYVPAIILGISIESMNGADARIFGSIFGILFLILFLIMIVGVVTITIALKTAFYRIVKTKDYGEMGSDDYFFFLKKPYLNKTIIFSMAYFGISILAVLLCYLPIFYAMVPLSLMIVIYAFNPELTIKEIVTLSFNLGNKKWGITFGLILVIGFLSFIVGALLCGFGIYFTVSISYLIQYFIYKKVIGFEDAESFKLIGENSDS